MEFNMQAVGKCVPLGLATGIAAVAGSAGTVHYLDKEYLSLVHKLQGPEAYQTLLAKEALGLAIPSLLTTCIVYFTAQRCLRSTNSLVLATALPPLSAAVATVLNSTLFMLASQYYLNEKIPMLDWESAVLFFPPNFCTAVALGLSNVVFANSFL